MLGQHAPEPSSRRFVAHAVTRATLWVILIGFGLGCIFFAITEPPAGADLRARNLRFTMSALIPLASGISLVCLAKGRLGLAVGLLALVLYSVPLFSAIVIGVGVHAIGMVLWTSLILLTGFTWGARHALVVTAICIATAVGLSAAEITGAIPGPTPGTLGGPVFYGLILCMLFGLACWITVRYSRIFHDALDRAARSAQELTLANEALQKSEAALSRAQAVAGTGSWKLSLATRTMTLTPEAYRILGLPMSATPTIEEFVALTHVRDRPSVGEIFQDAILKGIVGEFERRIVRPDGMVRVVHEKLDLVPGADGKPDRLIGVLQDVTERKTAEKALRESDARANAIIEFAPNAMLIVAADGTIQRVNSRAEDLFGYDRSQLVGHSIEMLVPESFRAQHKIDRLGYTQDAHVRPMGLRRMNLRALRKDGSQMPVEIGLAPYHAESGLCVIAAVTDISERVAMQSALAEHRDRLEELVQQRTVELVAARNQAERMARVRSEFLANMSHELKTPLNAVLGFAHLGSKDAGSEAVRRRFDRIHGAGQHLLALIDNLLDITKLEVGRVRLRSEPFRLADVLDNARGRVVQAARVKGLACEVDNLADPADWVIGDARRLQQVLVNLLSNGIKFTRQGGVKLVVTRQAEDCRFEIVDSGAGMTAEQIERLFVAFELGDSSSTRRLGGAGLGLAISQRLAEAMGGAITVSSSPGAGSLFTLAVRLPLTAEPDATQPQPQGADQHRLSGLRVLIADDSEVHRMVIDAMLTAEGAEVCFAVNGREVIDRLVTDGASALDLVLMDLRMPEMDGLEATALLQTMAPELPIVGLTGHSLAEERERCIRAGMVDYIAKPIEVDDLVDVVLRASRKAVTR